MENRDYKSTKTDYYLNTMNTNIPKNKSLKRSRRILVRNIIWVIIHLLLLFLSGSLIIYGLIINNYTLAKMSLVILIITLLHIMILALIAPDSLYYPPKFQIKLKESYHQLFKNPPSSYYSLGAVIAVFDIGCYYLIVLLFCETFNTFCWIVSIIFAIFFISGLVLCWLGLILILKRGK